MNIEQVSELKGAVESEILTLLREFESKTGLAVLLVNLDKDYSDPAKNTVSAVKLQVIL